MKSLKSYLNKYSADQIAKNEYYHKELINFFGDNIPEKYNQLYENCNLLDNEFILETLQTHDTKKLQDKLKKEYDNIEFEDYSGENKKSFYMILPDKYHIYDFKNDGGRLDADYNNIEKFNNILSFYNYYVSFTKKIKDKWTLFIEPRYSDNITSKIFNSHASIYHFTDGESAKSILKNGLRCKQGKYREFPERIFLWVTDKKLEDNLEHLYDFILKIGNRNKLYKNELSILQIRNNNKFDIYNDTAMKDEEAVFTYDNIPKEYIKEIKVNNLTYKNILNYLEDEH